MSKKAKRVPFEVQQGTRRSYMSLDGKGAFNAMHLAAILGRNNPKANPFHVALDVARIYQLAKQQAALSVASCNYGLTPRQEKRQENIAKQIGTIAAWYGLTASCYGDPRGYVVRLDGPGIIKNGWGDGFGVA